MNIITDAQWAEWRLSPVTQAFLRYILLMKQDIGRIKMDMFSQPVDKIDAAQLSVMNGVEQACNGILTLDLKTMTEETHALEQVEKEYKAMLKDLMGVEL